jgi:hypothetical protein|uniref:Uncharacterized protein n=1 Tax=Bionectria ochroleuca TaxID=29856 RepID=A0A8H7TV37_BIOOC
MPARDLDIDASGIARRNILVIAWEINPGKYLRIVSPVNQVLGQDAGTSDKRIDVGYLP